MRIKSLWISKYKNVRNLSLKSMGSKLITLLVGQNGLGKSNLIEILALIFRDLDLCDEDQLMNWAYQDENFEYVMEYECHETQIKISCRKGSFTVFEFQEKKYQEISFDNFIRRRNIYLPDFILGYYSGENKRIRKIIGRHEENEIRLLRTFHGFKGRKLEPKLRKLFFTENSHSQLVLLTLALYKNSPDYSAKVRDLAKGYLKISSIQSFDIRFKNPPWYKKSKLNNGIDYLIANISEQKRKDVVKYPFWGLKGRMDQLLTYFYNYQIENIEPNMYAEEDIRGRSREVIEFKDIPIREFSEKILEIFPEPIDFFYSIEGASVVNILDSISISVKKKSITEEFIFDQLSEGEQQLLTVLGLILITGKDDCLFLLDEPDTHLNPKWQRDYVELLEEFNLNDHNSHIIVATHSPLIVQSSQIANVILFYQTQGGTIKAELSEIPFHSWRTDHVLTSPYFGLESARPKDRLLDAYMHRRSEILSKKKLSKKDEHELRSYEDDFGLMPTGETFDDLVAMYTIRNAATK
jgi:predicted ATP-dependent endonuclease of OLD family